MNIGVYYKFWMGYNVVHSSIIYRISYTDRGMLSLEKSKEVIECV